MLDGVLKNWKAVEVTPMELYTDMFRLGDGYLQRDGEERGKYKANPIGYYRYQDKAKGSYRILFEDTFQEVLAELQQADDFAILNGITYFGRKNVQAHASKMFAMIFDIDGVTDKTLKDANNRYLFQDDATQEFPYRLLGKPVFLSDNMPKIAASAKTVLYGDLSGLSINIRENMEIQVLREKYATQHALGVIAWAEVDSRVTDHQKMAVLEMAAG